MDVLEFLRERRRLCNSYENCVGCPLADRFCDRDVKSDEDRKSEISTVEQWSKDHPRKTRQSVFMERYPESIVGDSGVLRICPRYISAAHRDGDGCCKEPAIKCVDCCCEFWMQEVESYD